MKKPKAAQLYNTHCMWSNKESLRLAEGLSLVITPIIVVDTKGEGTIANNVSITMILCSFNFKFSLN